MTALKRRVVLGITLLLLSGCTAEIDSEENPPPQASIDERSYALGAMGAFAEMVDAGVKELALSTPLEANGMESLMEDARRIVSDHNVELYRESDFLVTDLFSGDLTEGKEVLLIYRGETLQKYMELKAEKDQLLEEGRYENAARAEIARRFGKLLSYSDEKIQALLEGGEGS